MFSRLCFFLLILISSQKVMAANPALPLGSVYTYSYCAGDPNSPCQDRSDEVKSLTIKVARIEVTAAKPTSTYVFEVANEGRNYEIKLDQALWDKLVNRMLAYAADKKRCEDGSLANGTFEDASWSNETWDGKDVAVCSAGADSEFQSGGVSLYNLASPMPLHAGGDGYWPNGTGYSDYEGARNYYRERFFMAAEYLEFLGVDTSPNSRFDASFTLQKVEP